MCNPSMIGRGLEVMNLKAETEERHPVATCKTLCPAKASQGSMNFYNSVPDGPITGPNPICQARMRVKRAKIYKRD